MALYSYRKEERSTGKHRPAACLLFSDIPHCGLPNRLDPHRRADTGVEAFGSVAEVDGDLQLVRAGDEDQVVADGHITVRVDELAAKRLVANSHPAAICVAVGVKMSRPWNEYDILPGRMKLRLVMWYTFFTPNSCMTSVKRPLSGPT